MTITIVLLEQVVEPIPITFPPANAITVEFAIRNDADTNVWYRYSQTGIPADTVDVQAFLNAESASLYIPAKAGGVTLTQGQVNVGSFAYQHWSNRNVFAAAHYRYTVGMLGGAATLAAYRTVLSDAYAELAPLSGSQFDTEFANERTALGLTTAIGSMTLAQCQAFATLLDRWLSARRVDVLWSMSFYGMRE